MGEGAERVRGHCVGVWGEGVRYNHDFLAVSDCFNATESLAHALFYIMDDYVLRSL